MTTRGISPVPGHITRALLAGIGSCVLMLACGAPYWRHHSLAAGISLVAITTLGAAGGLLLGAGDRRARSGLLLLIGTAFVCLAWLACWNNGIWPTVGFCSEGAGLIFSGAAVLAYPVGRLADRADRLWVYAATGVLIVGEMFVELVSRPEWNGLSPDVLWPGPAPDRSLFDRAITVINVLQLLLACWYLVLLARRARALPRSQRPTGVRPLIATGVAAAAIALSARSQTWTDLDALFGLYVVQNTISVVLSLTVLSGPLQERWHEVIAPHRVVRMTSATCSVATVQDALAAALHDPPLRLLLWVPTEQSYQDRLGRRVGGPEDLPEAPERWWTQARTDDESPLALIELAEDLQGRPAVVDAVLRAGSQALLTAQLQALATGHLEQVLAAQARIEESRNAERQRLENDLRAGARRRLVTLAEQLDQLGRDRLPEPAGSVTALCHQEVLATLSDLEAIARGLHPPVLRANGLGAALDEVAGRLGLEMHLAVDAGRHPPSVEATAYFALCEGLTNVAKYAPDARVQVEITEADGWLHGSVADDGPGGARVLPGGGLAGIDDRIRASHGWTAVESDAGVGTRLRVSLPSG